MLFFLTQKTVIFQYANPKSYYSESTLSVSISYIDSILHILYIKAKTQGDFFLNNYYPFVNEPLPYSYDALEPFIDTKTMELHHDRHLQTYIDNLNKLLADHPEAQSMSLERLLMSPEHFPGPLGIQIKNNAGGVFNHRFFFNNLAPVGTTQNTGVLADHLGKVFGSMDEFKKQMSQAGLSVFGSGYAWLVGTMQGRLQIMTTANQDTPLPQNLCPVLNLDVWEHAYYLKHYNERNKYIEDWFQVINWDHANLNYLICLENGFPI